MLGLSGGVLSVVSGVFLGLIIELSLQGFVNAGVLDSAMVLVYQLLNLVAIFVFVQLTRYWGVLYLLGWWSGSGINLYSGVFGGLEFTLYSVVLALVLLSKLRKRIG